MTTLVFADVETTGTDPARHHLWEIGLVVRPDDGPDREYLWQIRPDLGTADPMALRIGGYYQRLLDVEDADLPVGTVFEVISPTLLHPDEPYRRKVGDLATELACRLNGVSLVAANIAFDAAFLAAFLRAHGQVPCWDYHLVEVESYAAGALGVEPPWKLDRLMAEFGVSVPAKDRHTALGDARGVRDLFDVAAARGVAGRAVKP